MRAVLTGGLPVQNRRHGGGGVRRPLSSSYSNDADGFDFLFSPAVSHSSARCVASWKAHYGGKVAAKSFSGAHFHGRLVTFGDASMSDVTFAGMMRFN